MDITLFQPHQGQKSVIDGFADSDHKFGVVSSPRQWGKSLLGQNLLLYWLLGNNNQKGAWVSPIYNQAKKVFQELVNASHDVILEKNKADLTIKFINGSTVNFLSAERYDSIRGFSFSHVIIDEGAFIREVALSEAILPTLTAIGKKCLVISTPKGKANWFFNYWLRGQQNNSTYISFKGKSSDNPHVDQLFIDEQRKSLPHNIYIQEYEGAFVDSSADVFSNLDSICSLNSYTSENKRERCYIGIDTGLSDDYSAICVIADSGRVQYMERRNGQNVTTIAERFISIISKYNIGGGYIESNGIGKAMCDLIIPKYRKLKPFFTTQDNKTTIVRGVIEDIESGVLELPSKDFEPQLYREMSLYTYKLSNTGKMSFSHPNGEKDDMIDSLMLANHARNTMASGKAIHIGNKQQEIIVPGQQMVNNRSIKTNWGVR